MTDSIHHQLLEAVRHYQMPAEGVQLLRSHKPLVIAGVTASGKDSVAAYLNENSDFRHVTTHTTRPPRHDEQNGKRYWFVNDEQMLKLLDEHAMLEAKVVHRDNIYGTSLKAYEQVTNSGRNPLLITDVQGVVEVAKSVVNLQAVFLLPPNFETWMERLDKRVVMSHVERTRRLQSAREEIEYALHSRHFSIFVNRDVNTTARAILDNVSNPSEQHHNRELAQQLLDHIRYY